MPYASLFLAIAGLDQGSSSFGKQSQSKFGPALAISSSNLAPRASTSTELGQAQLDLNQAQCWLVQLGFLLSKSVNRAKCHVQFGMLTVGFQKFKMPTDMRMKCGDAF